MIVSKNANKVFIAASLDGYIADRNGGLEWLYQIPNPDNHSMGFDEFLAEVDAILMGRNTFETVCGFGGDWPYSKPVFVMSTSLLKIPEIYDDKATLVHGTVLDIVDLLNQRGYYRLYIDGGAIIQSFLQNDLIDEMTITTIPILLGGGIPLYGNIQSELEFELLNSKVFLDSIVQSHYRRKR
jgi:dihydrofolate reductase